MDTPSKKRPSRNPGGRPKGVANKRSWQMRLELEQKGFDPVAEFIKAYGELENADARIQSLLSLFRHVYPQLNPVDATALQQPAEDDDHISERSTEALLALAVKQP